MSESAVKNILRYCTTARHLRVEQLFFFLVKPLRKKIALYHFSKKVSEPKTAKLKLRPSLISEHSLSGNTFTFLNREKVFAEGKIDWNFSEYGLLWNYNLNYFDFLLQENGTAQEGIKLIHHFINNSDLHFASYDPYPISLRGINWIKFLIKNDIDDSRINESLFRQYTKLSHETERHLGANHLLENGFSLLFAAFYFHDKKFLKCAENILQKELNEQVLDDGAHFELSTMYHRIILNHLLDCINLEQNNTMENGSLSKLLSEKASAMLSWMNNMTFRNGTMPDFNDSTLAGAIPAQLNAYAKQLGINRDTLSLSVSRYRKFSFPKYELILDAGNIIPKYNPGHTHADMLSFCLNIDDKPVIIDCATSTYENNSRRNYERSTSAHNTISVNDLNQSDIWASFRVGRRAKIVDKTSGGNYFSATLKGFSFAGITHKREWKFVESKILITDFTSEKYKCKAFLHFHPGVSIRQENNSVSGENFSISFRDHSDFFIEDYDCAEGFNRTVKAKVVVVLFSGRLYTEIIL